MLVHEVIHKPSLAKLLARIPNADRLLEHIVASHTTHEDVGKVARDAGVKTLVLTHYVPVDDPALTDEIWIDRNRDLAIVTATKRIFDIWNKFSRI